MFADGFVMWCKPDQISRKLPGAGQLYMQRNEKTVPRPVGGPGNSWGTVFPGRLDVGFRIHVCIASILDHLMSAIYIHVYKGPGERLEMHHVKARDPGFHTPRSHKFLAHALRDCSR